MSQNQTQTYIPKFSYPSEKVKDEKKYFELMSKSEKGNYLFSRYGFWHGGVHLGESFGSKICSIADGELVAYRINEKYLQNDDEKEKNKGLFSTGFFLVRHKIEYPKDNKLTFFSLYMHTAKKQDYIKEEYFAKTKGTNIFLRRGYESSAYSPAVGNELPSNTKIITDGNWINNRARILYAEGRDINLSQNLTIHNSNVTDTHKRDVPKLEEIFSNKKFNEVIVLPTPKPIKAGEVIGLMGEYNASKQSDNKVVHIEVFTSNDIKTFSQKAQAQDKNLPQSFSWAKIIDVESKDHISIFEDISNFLLPLKYQTDEIKMNKSYAELFELIDEDHDGKMEVQEIKDAVVNKKIKEITSKYIVKHLSEWDDKINMAEVLGNFFDEHEDKFSDILKLRKHYKNERKRIEKLEFFSKCGNIEGFPKEDKIYHIHPIGLVGAFSKECIIYEKIYAKKGKAYSSESITSYSNYNLPINKNREIYGNSRIHGDISKEMQKKVIDILVSNAKQEEFNKEEIALLLAIAKIESGFNVDATAGTTSASGLGQFVKKTGTEYGLISVSDYFDVEKSSKALISHFKDNKKLAISKKQDPILYIYKYHHDGPSSDYGGMALVLDVVIPLKNEIMEALIC